MDGLIGIKESLRQALVLTRSAARQYAVHANMCRNWGLNELFEEQRSEASGKLLFGEELSLRLRNLNERIEGFGEEPCYPSSVLEMFEKNLRLEGAGLASLQKLSPLCEFWAEADICEIVETALIDAEDQIERLEARLDSIDEIGLDQYLYDVRSSQHHLV